MKENELITLLDLWKNGNESSYDKVSKDLYGIVIKLVKCYSNDNEQSKIETESREIMGEVHNSVNKLKDPKKYKEWLRDIIEIHLGIMSEIPEVIIPPAVHARRIEK